MPNGTKASDIQRQMEMARDELAAGGLEMDHRVHCPPTCLFFKRNYQPLSQIFLGAQSHSSNLYVLLEYIALQ